MEMLGTIRLDKLKHAVAEDLDTNGKCNVEGCECKQFQATRLDQKKQS